MKKVSRSFAVLIFVIAVSVFPFNTASAQSKWYVGVFGGYAFSSDASLTYYNYDYDHDYDYNYEHDVNVQEAWVFGVKFGYTPPVLKYFSFEFEYSYLNPDVDRTVFPRSGTDYTAVEGDVKLNNFMFNAIAKYPTGKIHPYVGAGIGFSNIDVSLLRTSSEGYAYSISHDDTVFAWQILLGVEIDLTNNFSLDIGYRYFSAEDESDDDDDDDHHHGHYHDYYHGTQFDYDTSMVTLGLKYRF